MTRFLRFIKLNAKILAMGVVAILFLCASIFCLSFATAKEDTSVNVYAETTPSGKWSDKVSDLSTFLNFLEGEGSKESPYKINNAKDFALTSKRIYSNSIYGTKYFKLTKDIDLSEHYWNIAFGKRISDAVSLTIYFDGQGHTISNLISTNGQTLFYRLDDVSNLTISNANISGVEDNNGGILVGKTTNTVKISNCKIVDSVIQSESASNLGGYVGFSSGPITLTNCSISRSTITTTGSNVGGLIGKINDTGKLENCVINNVSVSAGENVGGISAYSADTLTLTNCSISNSTISTKTGNTGGILGYVEEDITFSNMQLTDMTVKSTENNNSIGILAGYCNGSATINQVFVNGKIESKSANTGGLIGYVNSSLSVKGSQASVTITNKQTDSVNSGGIVGSVNGELKIESCLASGNITADRGNIGGFVGKFNKSGSKLSIAQSYYKGILTNNSIYPSLKDCVGGAVGCLLDCSTSSAITDCFIDATISITNRSVRSGVNQVIGYCVYDNNAPKISIDDTIVKTSITNKNGPINHNQYIGDFGGSEESDYWSTGTVMNGGLPILKSIWWIASAFQNTGSQITGSLSAFTQVQNAKGILPETKQYEINTSVSTSNGVSKSDLSVTVSTSVGGNKAIEGELVTLSHTNTTGYAFNNYTLSVGNMKDTNTFIIGNSNVTVTGNWNANTYYVRYNGNNSTSGSMANSTHKYDVAQNLKANAYERKYTVTYNYNYTGSTNTSENISYTFNGWATSSNGSKKYDNQASVINLTSEAGETFELYAVWKSNSVTLPKPTRTGYTFGGWYKQAGCTNKVGVAGRSYAPTANITLYAKWTANQYTVTLNNQSPTTAGTTSVTATYKEDMPDITLPTKTGYTFGGYVSNLSNISYKQIDVWDGTRRINYNIGDLKAGDQLGVIVFSSVKPSSIDFNDVSVDSWNWTEVTGGYNIVVNYTIKDYDLYGTSQGRGYDYNNMRFIDLGGVSSTANVKVISTQKGHFYYDQNGKSAKKYDIAGNTTLYANWIPNIYKVTLDKQSGSGGTSEYYYYYNTTIENSSITGKIVYFYKDSACIQPLGSNSYTIEKPSRTGYYFFGYYAQQDGQGKEYIGRDCLCCNNLWKDYASDVTLYAYWIPIVYVKLDKQGGDGGTNGYYYIYNKYIDNIYYYSNPSATTKLKDTGASINCPTREGYTFGGYYPGTNGSGKQYVDSSGNCINSLYTVYSSDVTLYAKWTANNYTLTINPNGGYRASDNSTSNITVTKAYGTTESISERKRAGYTLTGYTLKNTSTGSTTEIGGAKFVFNSSSKTGTFTQGSVACTLVANWKVATRTVSVSVLKGSNSIFNSGDELTVNGTTLINGANNTYTSSPYTFSVNDGSEIEIIFKSTRGKESCGFLGLHTNYYGYYVAISVDGTSSIGSSDQGKDFPLINNPPVSYTYKCTLIISSDCSIKCTWYSFAYEESPIYCSCTISSCLEAGTKIAMADGSTKNIEEIMSGDKVLSYNTEKGIIEETTVLERIDVEKKKTLTVRFKDGTFIKTTSDHMFYSEKGWVAYSPHDSENSYPGVVEEQLSIGDKLFSENGSFEKEVISIEENDYGSVYVYNLKLENNFNFFANGVLAYGVQ